MSGPAMSFAEAVAYSAGTIALTLAFGCGIVGQRIALQNKPVLLRRAGSFRPTASLLEDSAFTRFPPVAREGGGEGAFSTGTLPEAGGETDGMDWDALEEWGDRVRMGQLTDHSGSRPAVGEPRRRDGGGVVCPTASLHEGGDPSPTVPAALYFNDAVHGAAMGG